MKAKLLLALTICMSVLTSTVYAAEGFSDVTKETKHYESIMYLQEKGIITGEKDSRFRPDDKITVREALTMLEIAFGNPDNLPDWNEWVVMSDNWADYKTDWEVDTDQFLGNYLGGVRLETASRLLLSVNGCKAVDATTLGINPKVWGMDNTENQNERKSVRETPINSLILRGYDKNNFEGKDCYTYITRAEFCDMVAWADKEIAKEKENGSTEKLEIKIDGKITSPIEYTYVGDSLTDKEKVIFISKVVSDCLSVPDWLMQSYIKDGNKLFIVEEDEYIKKFPQYKDSQALHVTHPNGKQIIYVKEGKHGIEVAIHEFGHYLHSKSAIRDKRIKEIMEQEADGLSGVMRSTYCKTNIYEYFAEAFEAYMTYPKELAKKAPMTYKAMDDICKSFIESKD